MVNQKISSVQSQEIVELYLDGHSTVMLARKFNVRPITVRRLLERQNTPRRTATEAGQLASLKGRLFGQHLLQNYCKNLTKEKAYVLGVLCGDAYLHKARHSYQIGLQAIDKDFVMKFSKCIETIYRIKPSVTIRDPRRENWNPLWCSRICSKAVFNDIARYSSFRTSEWTVPFDLYDSPIQIKSEFLGGFFDSEGHVDVNYRKIIAVSINITGLNGIRILLDSMGIKSKLRNSKEKRENRKTLYFLNIQDKESIKIFNKTVGFNIRRKQILLEKLVENFKE